MKLRQCLFAFVFLIAAVPAFSQVSLTALDTPYSQNFDSLPTSGTGNPWTDNTTIAGWYAKRTAGTLAINAGDGSSNAGALYSFGTLTNAERALGSIGSGGTGTVYWGVRLQNNTGGTITSLDIAYTGEQWRDGGTATTGSVAQTVTFSYLTGSPVSTDLSAAGTAMTALDFTSPIFGHTAGLALDGNAAANRTAKSSTISGLSIAPGAEIMLRWTDIDHPSSDHALAIDDFSITPHGTAAGPTLSINDVSLSEGDAGTTTFTFTVHLSAISASDVTFDIATADNTAIAGSDYIAKSLPAQTIPAGSQDYAFDVVVNGDLTAEPNETFFVNISGASVPVTDSQGLGTIVNDDIAITKIHDVQGSVTGTTPGTDDTSPMNGQSVYVEGVVTSNLLGTLQGFFLQEEDADADADPNTSEGIFVFCSSCTANAVAEGQRVRVNGTVQEFFGMTELSATPANVVVTDAGNHLAEVTPVHVALPIGGNVNSFYESVEGMLVQYDTLTVTEYFQLFRYGQVVLVGGDRPRTFTEDNTPDAVGYAAHLDALAHRQVILDDDRDGDEAALLQPDGQRAAYWPHTNGGFSLGVQGQDWFRGGDQVNGLVGVVQWARPSGVASPASTWRIRPSASYPVTFTPMNPRPLTPPDVGGSIRAVGMNLLNYFTTIDTTSSSSSGPCGPGGTLDCRGADSVAELNRQRARAALVICTLNPDVAAFMELENTTPTATINDLLGAVNTSCGGAHPYAFVNTGGTLGTDAIRVMQVYRTGVLSPVGSPIVDLDPVHNRPPTAQGFDVVDATNPAFGQRFIVVANHLKSKGSCPGSGADDDQNDGQGCWAATRTDQATRTMTWINSTVVPAYGSSNVLLLGDFNSYAHETPVTTLEAGGYHDLETELHGTNAYSYLFSGELGHLDFAFANASLQSQITGADAWHINADEVDLFDYNDEIKDTGEATFEEKPDGSALNPARTLWDSVNVGAFRASDHDPVVVGLFPIPVAQGQLTITPTSLSFGNQTVGTTSSEQTVTLGNSGNASLDVTALDVANAPFARTATGSCAASGTITIAAGANCTLTYTFAPTATGAANQTLSVTANAPGSGTIDLSGTGTQGHLTITPTSLPFGNQTLGTTSSEHAVTLGNSGDASLDVTALDAANAPFARTATGTCAASGTITIAAGGNCTLTYTFAPTAMGTANQTLSVTANAPGSGTISLSGTGTQGHLTITPTSINFGNQAVGTTSGQHLATLGNNGSASLDVTVDAATAPFARAGGTCAMSGTITITAGASCTLTYTFAPTTTGAANQTLNVSANAPGSGSITLMGTGVEAQANISVSIDDSEDYVQVGSSVTYTIVVTNGGPNAASVTVADVLPANLDNGVWTCTGSGGGACASGNGNALNDVATLPAGATATYSYTATVLAEDAGFVTDVVTATVNGDVFDPNTANNTASDTDTIVIFRDDFDGL
jgi:uncharacterized repeat protein (TIGR01451 family)